MERRALLALAAISIVFTTVGLASPDAGFSWPQWVLAFRKNLAEFQTLIGSVLALAAAALAYWALRYQISSAEQQHKDTSVRELEKQQTREHAAGAAIAMSMIHGMQGVRVFTKDILDEIGEAKESNRSAIEPGRIKHVRRAILNIREASAHFDKTLEWCRELMPTLSPDYQVPMQLVVNYAFIDTANLKVFSGLVEAAIEDNELPTREDQRRAEKTYGAAEEVSDIFAAIIKAGGIHNLPEIKSMIKLHTDRRGD